MEELDEVSLDRNLELVKILLEEVATMQRSNELTELDGIHIAVSFMSNVFTTTTFSEEDLLDIVTTWTKQACVHRKNKYGI